MESAAEVTLLKLIKLTYIAHGWYLGVEDKVLLGEPIYAWKHGPMIYSLYSYVKKYGNDQIDELLTIKEISGIPMPDRDIEPFLADIWKAYGKYNTEQLCSIAHQPNTPWDKVWNHEGRRTTKWIVIANDLIREHYKEKIAAVHARRLAHT